MITLGELVKAFKPWALKLSDGTIMRFAEYDALMNYAIENKITQGNIWYMNKLVEEL